MTKKEFSRRDFHALSAAALGGLMTAGLVGCASDTKETTDGDAPAGTSGTGDDTSTVAKHACRGLNECKGKGADGNNDCAGAGTCATVAAHECAGHNECKGQGGCGDTPGANECAGKGGCAVPMKGGMWEKARELFETRMKEQEKEVHPAPEAA